HLPLRVLEKGRSDPYIPARKGGVVGRPPGDRGAGHLPGHGRKDRAYRAWRTSAAPQSGHPEFTLLLICLAHPVRRHGRYLYPCTEPQAIADALVPAE